MKTAFLILSTLLWALTSQGVARAEQSSLRSAGKPADAKAQSGRAASTSNHEHGPQNGRNRVPARKPITASQSDIRVAHAENRARSTMQMPPAMHSAATPQSLRAPNGWANGGMVAPRAPAAVARRTGAQLLTSAHRRNANSPLIDGKMTTRREASAAIDGRAIHRSR
jgi:hypothetical protein